MSKKYLLLSSIGLLLFLIIVLLPLFFEKGDKSLENASRDEIINVFKSNAAEFFAVAKRLETVQGQLYAYADPTMNDIIYTDQDEQDLDYELQKSIDIITEELHFGGIYGPGSQIEFNADPGDPPRGIFYSRYNIVPYGFAIFEPIIDGWYYYERYEMGGI